MKINITTEIEFDCLCLKSLDEVNDIKAYKNAREEKLSITINKEDAMKFLFRMIDRKFFIGDYLCILDIYSGKTIEERYKQYISKIILIYCKDHDYNAYIVTNIEDSIKEILKFYNKAVSIEKLGILFDCEFSNSSKEDLEGVIDEFDLEDEEEILDNDNTEEEVEGK